MTKRLDHYKRGKEQLDLIENARPKLDQDVAHALAAVASAHFLAVLASKALGGDEPGAFTEYEHIAREEGWT